MENEVSGKQILAVVEQLAENVGRLISSGERILSLEEGTVLLFKSLKQQVDVNAEEAGRRAEAIQRNIEFIIQQQAQFSADMERLRAAQERAEHRWERIERMWERTEESVRSLHAIAQIHESEITALAQAQSRTTSQMAETDERINVLVSTVEQLISERRNGGGKREESSG